MLTGRFADTFVHPVAFDVLQGAALREPIAGDDPELQRRVGDYLATQAEILQRFHGATNAFARNKALSDLVAHADRHRDLIEEATRTRPPTAASPKPVRPPPRHEAPDNDTDNKPAKRTRRTPKTTK